jgi:GNAT superfamily N-acetyltransferase
MIRRLEPGDERLLRAVCRRFKERVPSEEAARLLVYELDVRDRFRRRGVGRALVDEGADARGERRRAEAVGRHLVDNEPARRTYEAARGEADDEATLVYTWRFSAGSRAPS